MAKAHAPAFIADQPLCEDVDDISPEDGATSEEETWPDQACST